MADIIISRFPGIAPYQESADPGPNTGAELAENVLLARGVLKPANAPSFLAAGHSGDFVKFDGAWVSGLTRPLLWKIGNKSALFSRGPTRWNKRIGNTTVPLGITRPAAPDISSKDSWLTHGVPVLTNDFNGPGDTWLSYGAYKYYVTVSKTSNGSEIETRPFGPLSTDPYYAPVEVPATYPGAEYDAGTDKYWDRSASVRRRHVISFQNVADDPDAKFWNIYRSDDGDTAQLVASVSISTTIYTDSVPSTSRGRRIDYQRDPNGANYRFAYVVTWERNVEGVLEESGPSEPSTIEVFNPGVLIQRPASPPTGVQNWSIYRLSSLYDPTVALQLVVRLPVATTSYIDTKPNLTLGAGLTTSYTSAAGDEISFLPPAVFFDGLAGPHAGIFFGWKGSTLYWSEPGVPDAWPAVYTTEAPAEIVACVSQGSQLVVLTKKGVMFGVGASPENFFLTPGLTGDGCGSYRVVCSSEFGIFYLGLLGINLIAGSQVSNISLTELGPTYFTDAGIDLAQSTLVEFGGALFLFHNLGVLRYDLKRKQFTTHTQVAGAAFSDLETGQLVIRVGTDLLVMNGSADALNMRYRTGEIVLSDPAWKYFDRFEFFGSGTVQVKLEIDGSVGPELDVDMDATLIRDRIVHAAYGEFGRSAKIHIRGTGTIKEIRVFVQKVRI